MNLPPDAIIIGNHLYKQCDDCGRLVRMTGWFGGWHLCLTDEEKAHKAQHNSIEREQARRHERWGK